MSSAALFDGGAVAFHAFGITQKNCIIIDMAIDTSNEITDNDYIKQQQCFWSITGIG